MTDEPNMFSVLEGEFDGYPVVAMICSDLKNYRGKNTTPWFLGLSTPLSKPTAQGLPTSEEAEDLNRWEDAVDREIRSQCNAIFVGRVTWKAHRELLYYISKPKPVVQQIQKLLDGGTTRTFAFRYDQDPEWANVSIYLRYVRRISVAWRILPNSLGAPSFRR